MPKFRLSVDETRNTLKYVEIDTQLSEIELDALLSKLEKNEIASVSVLAESLEAHNVKVTNITSAEQAYYTDAATLEIEELKETMVFEFLTNLKARTTDEEFKDILAATDQDIKFNRVGFGKTTGTKKFIEICTGCANVFLRY